MREHYRYQCFDCKKSFRAEDIEDNGIYLCPDCGRAEKNHPLNGVLLIEYDYQVIAGKISRNTFLEYAAGQILNYPFLLPLDIDPYSGNALFKDGEKEIFNALKLPAASCRRVSKNLFILDETHNPTFSYKDRASIPIVMKALQLGITDIAAASTGNAGSSLAGICAAAGIKAHIFVPENIPEAKLLQIAAYGAAVYVVKGDYDTAFDLCLEAVQKNSWYNRNTAFNPITIDGKKSAAYDIFIGMQGTIPDKIVVPSGDGVIISGIYKGFSELLKLGWIEKMPQLIAVQAEGSSAIVKYLSTGTFTYEPAETLADSISAGAPRNLFMAANAVQKSEGFGITVTDDEILAAQKRLAAEKGILAEPSAAAAYAGYMKIEKEIPERENVLLLISGSGLKDTGSILKWIDKPSPQPYDTILQELTK